MRRVITLSVVVVTAVLLSFGAAGVVAADEHAATAEECVDESDNDLVGCWNGVHHDHDPGIDQSDGLTDAELAELTHLQMARVEYLRERPFAEEVPVEVITREEFSGQQNRSGSDAEFNRWNDQVWKALFVIGEDRSSAEVLDEAYSGAVAGFYSPAEDRIVVVVEDDEEVRVSPTTLHHELGHAMQDQYGNLTDPRYTGRTQDAGLAIDGIVEGEAVYLEERYRERCGEEWTCVDEPAGDGGSGGSEPNLGVLLTILQPYSDGAPYVDELIEERGWDAVNETFATPPNATTETIHREPFEPTPIEFEDTAEGGWETYPDQGIDGAETAGEASIFVSMWYQSSNYDAGVIPRNDLFDTNHPYQDYNYSDEVSRGWANDELYPYRNDDGGTERDGYVWVTEWQTPEDAEQFHAAYRDVLDAHDAQRRDDGVLDVADGPFRGAYGVERNGTTVTIVHAMEPESVFELRPGIDLPQPETEEPTTPSDGTEEPTTPSGGNGETTEGPGEGPAGGTPATEGETPGFGVAAALAALVAGLALARRR